MVNAVKILIEAEDKASKTIDTVNDNLVDLGKETKTVGQTMSDFGERNKEAFQKMAVSGGIAFAAIVAGAKSSISAFAESQAQLVRVDQIIKNTDLKSVGLGFDQAAKAAREFGDKLQNSVGISGELAAESYAKLLQVTKNQTEAQKLATLAADLSVAKQMDMGSATKVVTMALAGNQKILKEYGIEVSDTATKQEVMGALMEKVGGQAEAFGKTIEGQQQILSETFGDMQEAIGGALAPAFQQLLAVVQPVIASFVSRATENPELLGNIILIAGSIAGLVTVVGTLGLALPAIVAGFTAVSAAITFLTGPIGLVVVAIIGLTTLIVANWDTIKNAIGSAIDYIVAKTEPFISWILGAWTTMTAGITEAWNLLRLGITELFQFNIEIMAGILGAFIELFRGNRQGFLDTLAATFEFARNAIRSFFANTLTGLVTLASTAWQNIMKGARAFIDMVVAFFKNDAKAMITEGFSNMFDGIAGVAKSIFNYELAQVEKFVNYAIGLLNNLIKVANSIPGVSISMISPVTIGRLAHGGIAGEGYFGGKTMADQGYATGGVVKGPGGNDKVPAMLTAGEVVLNAAQQRTLASQLGGGQGQVVNLYVSGNNFYGSDDEFAEKIGDTFMQKFKLMASFESF